MKKWIKNNLWIWGLLVVIIVLVIVNGTKRNSDKEFDSGSNIKIEKLNTNQIDNLKKLCKVWGVVKYYHPEVVAGNVNFDYELFRVMPDTINAKNSQEANKVIYTWVKNLGDVEENSSGKNDENKKIALERDLSWIKNTNYLDKDLSQLLVKISNSNISKRNKAYTTFDKDVGLSNFENENLYEEMDYDDDGYKLLALFRYWNIIEYYYPYTDIIEENWDEVLTTFIPKFVNTESELDYKLAISELTTKIHDPHAGVYDINETLTKYWGNKYAPIEFDLVEDSIVIKKIFPKYKNKCELKQGDIVLEINDKDIFEVIKEKSKYRSLSRKEAIVNCLQGYLFRTSNDSIKLKLKRDGKDIIKNVKCYNDQSMFDIKEPSHKLIDENIGYINPGQLSKNEIDKIMDKFMNTEGIIVDLREYPSEFIVYDLGKMIISKPTIFSKISLPSQSVPGEFIFEKDQIVNPDDKKHYKGKVTILMNERSQSQSEFTVMALRKGTKAKVIGSNSIGTDGNITEVYLPGGVTTTITGLGVYNPDGSQTQRIGLKPDIYIKPTIDGIKKGRDELLEKAIDVIKTK
ncbi:S41 family peptidase [Paraclostridium bifermentans]|uniref:S41 family peptidase n=1 Tax=Paraclostridium bifermentans TaxID=1490 RepID=UPI00374EDC86